MSNLLQPMLPKQIAGLNKLAYNLWWSWHPEARNLFKVRDRPLWKASYHNPVQLLQALPPHRLVAAAQDPAFLRKYDSVVAAFDNDMTAQQTWIHTSYPQLKQQTIAYFSIPLLVEAVTYPVAEEKENPTVFAKRKPERRSQAGDVLPGAERGLPGTVGTAQRWCGLCAV